MNESQVPQSLDPNNNQDKNNEAFKTLTETTKILSQGRSDSVAIVGIISILCGFVTTAMIAMIAGLVIYSLNMNAQPTNNQPSPIDSTIEQTKD